MKIEFTEKQFRELLLAYLIGKYTKDAVDELQDKYDHDKSGEIENYLLEQAEKNGLRDLVDHFQKWLTPSDALSEESDRYTHEFGEDEFWHELITRLGQRDFEKEKTEDDIKQMKENSGWYPEKIHDYYEKYENEFEKYGIDRLEINEKASVSIPRETLY